MGPDVDCIEELRTSTCKWMTFKVNDSPLRHCPSLDNSLSHERTPFAVKAVYIVRSSPAA